MVNPEWLKNNFPCMNACPVNTEAGRYVNLIAQGRYDAAYNIARRPNPFASICGRICSAPCEDACSRFIHDKPVSIRALKRFVCERYGVESMTTDFVKLKGILNNKIKSNGKWVAIIGAGPAGLSAAHDLALLGYEVVVFEAQEVAGGMLRLGIPEYRLPRELIRMEINAILSLGFEIKFGKKLGKDYTIADLKENGYDAIFLAFGSHKSRDLQIEGANLDGVLKGIDFLLNANLGYRIELGEKIIVIGGGDVAIDVARTAARQEKAEEQTISNMTEALDIARSAVRFGAKEVHLVCLESRAEMPATEDDIAEALEEGIYIHSSKGPKRIIGENGVVSALEMIECVSLFNEYGRFDPSFASGTEEVLEADSIILAIGQTSDLSFISIDDGIEITPRNTIKVDNETLMTSAPGIFAGGDVAFGPRTAISAIADGKRAAQAIDEYLFGKKNIEEKIEINVFDTFCYHQIEDFEKIPRQKVPSLSINRRVGVAQIELGYDEETAQIEAKRCLRCWINTTFESTEINGSECILCGGCVDVCPENCIELFSSESMEMTEDIRQMLENEYGVMKDEFINASMMIKNDETCIRCGLCAKRCPVNCITMEGFNITKNYINEEVR